MLLENSVPVTKLLQNVNAEKRRLVTCPAFKLALKYKKSHFWSIFCEAPTVGELQNDNGLLNCFVKALRFKFTSHSGGEFFEFSFQLF